MRPFTFLVLYIGTLVCIAQGQVLINEVDADQSGPDRTEFVELYDGGVGGTSLDGLVLVFFNGSNDSSYRVVDLRGQVTGPSGFFIIGNPGVPSVGLELNPGNSGAIQNGPDAIALYTGTVDDFPNATPVTDANLVDALVYGTNDTDDFELLDVLTPGELQVNDSPSESMSRIPDGGDPRQASTYEAKVPTPGFANVVVDSLSVELSVESIAENVGPGSLTVIVSRSGPTNEPLAIQLAHDDPTEILRIAGNGEAVIEQGQSQIGFAVFLLDDLTADGTQIVTFTATAQGLNEGFAILGVTDDGDLPTLTLNEVYPDDRDDANFDDEGALDGAGKDEFVEFVNVTDVSLDLSNHTLSDSVALRHTFPEGTQLEPGCAIIVFGGGEVTEGNNAKFGGALVQVANGSNEFGLGLNNSGDLVRVLNEIGVEIASIRYDAVFGGSGSIARDPELTGDFVPHFDIDGGNEGPFGFTPGFRADGSPFCELGATLTLSLNGTEVIENAGNEVVILTIERSGETMNALQATLTSSDLSEISLPATVEIPANQTSVIVPVSVIDDIAQDGDVEVSIVATAPEVISGEIVITVTDDNDEPVVIFINEIDSDQPGDEVFEFVELYDGGFGNVPLDGLILVLFNGATSESYKTIDLRNQSTNAEGFFVVGDPDVPNIGLPVSGFTLQNGPDAVAIYRAPADAFPNGSFATDQDVVDAVIYGTDDDDAIDLSEVYAIDGGRVNEGSSNNETSAARQPDGGDLLQTDTFAALTPSPGTPNGQLNAYQTWVMQFAAIGGPQDDPDKDALPNILEYALSLNPLMNDSDRAPIVTRSLDDVLTVSVSGEQALPGNLAVAIETSASLEGDWEIVTPDAMEISVAEGGDRFITSFAVTGLPASVTFARLRLTAR